MPRESTRRSVKLRGPGSGLDFEIQQHDLTVWVTLSGVMNRHQLARLTRRITPSLGRRGCRVVLDGGSLRHIDYRAVKPLIQWSRHLRSFGHRLFLANWSDYLKAILFVEDWERELSPEPIRPFTWKTLVKVSAGPTP